MKNGVEDHSSLSMHKIVSVRGPSYGYDGGKTHPNPHKKVKINNTLPTARESQATWMQNSKTPSLFSGFTQKENDLNQGQKFIPVVSMAKK